MDHADRAVVMYSMMMYQLLQLCTRPAGGNMNGVL